MTDSKSISELILKTTETHIDLIRRAVIVIQNCYSQVQKENAFKYAFLVARKIAKDYAIMFDADREEMEYQIYSKILSMHSCNYFGDHFNLYR